MKKENIILNSDFLDFELFVVPEQDFPISKKSNPESRSILIVYENEANDPELETLLKKILSAAKINFEDQVLAIKTTSSQAYSFTVLQKKWKFKDAIFFGIPLKTYGINYKLDNYQPFSNETCRFLKVDLLSQINTNKHKKMALWSCLQEMYLKA